MLIKLKKTLAVLVAIHSANASRLQLHMLSLVKAAVKWQWSHPHSSMLTSIIFSLMFMTFAVEPPPNVGTQDNATATLPSPTPNTTAASPSPSPAVPATNAAAAGGTANTTTSPSPSPAVNTAANAGEQNAANNAAGANAANKAADNAANNAANGGLSEVPAPAPAAITAAASPAVGNAASPSPAPIGEPLPAPPNPAGNGLRRKMLQGIPTIGFGLPFGTTTTLPGQGTISTGAAGACGQRMGLAGNSWGVQEACGAVTYAFSCTASAAS
jgi:hypothetical protein